MENVFKDTIGKTISVTLQEDGAPVNLTNATVTYRLYSSGDDALKWSHTATVDSAPNGTTHYTTISGDWNTIGTYYLNVYVSWVSGAVKSYQGEYYEVIEGAENLVTDSEFLNFLDIPSENAKSSAKLEDYLEDAEVLVNLAIPVLATSTDEQYIRAKKTLIKLQAGLLYFLNSDEGNGINPNLREAKIRLWQSEYNLLADQLNSSMASNSTGNGVVRRVKNSCYSDSTSMYYEG